MTTQDKNVEIVKMLGAKIECYYHNSKTGFKMYYATGDCIEILRKYSNMPVGRDITNAIDIKNLAFHSNANWQFEALEYIYKKGYDWSIQSGNYCNINNPEGEEIVSINIDPKKGSSVFEALYEISKISK